MSIRALPQTSTHASTEVVDLAEAFRVFNRASEELSVAYAALQRQVAQLTEELALANGKLRQQYREKAALTERLALLLHALPAGVVVLDPAGLVIQSNPAAEHILGATPEGESWPGIAARLLVAADTPGEWLLAAGETTGEAPGRRLAIATTDLDSAGGRLVLLHDITEPHRLKEQAGRNERLAAMGQMAAGLAHQLRTPLAAALLYVAQLAREDLPPGLRAQVAERTAGRLRDLEGLIEDTLMYARGEAVGRSRCDTDALLADVAAVAEPLAKQHGVRLRTAHIGDAVTLMGNRKALLGALTALLENALRAAGPGGEVEVSCEPCAAQVYLRVRDDGPGIEPALRERLFEPFFTTGARGTGLGLAIVRGVARAHGGSVEVRPAAGRGTEFELVLPRGARRRRGRSAQPRQDGKGKP